MSKLNFLYCVRIAELYDDNISTTLCAQAYSMRMAKQLAKSYPMANIITKENFTGEILEDYDTTGKLIENIEEYLNHVI